MICKICNKNLATKCYCKSCFNKMQYGLIIKNKGKMVLNDSKKLNGNGYDFLNYHQYKKCLLCDSASNSKILCDSCLNKVEKIKELYENMSEDTFEINYSNEYNSKYDDANDKSIKMLALSIIYYEKYNNIELLVNAVDDIKYILNKRIQKKQDGTIVYIDEENSSCIKNRTRKTLDGHIVKSEGEEIIDNILCKYNIFHIYEPEVKEIINENKKIIADWAIPIKNTDQRIYIEYFGLLTKLDYNKRSQEKINLYKKNNLKLIVIEKYEVKNSSMLEEKIIKNIKKITSEALIKVANSNI